MIYLNFIKKLISGVFVHNGYPYSTSHKIQASYGRPDSGRHNIQNAFVIHQDITQTFGVPVMSKFDINIIIKLDNVVILGATKSKSEALRDGFSYREHSRNLKRFSTF